MAKLFLSHSTIDKTFVTKLAGDLKELGHNVWLDEWEIKVGDVIPKKISEGLSDCEYVVVVLSSASTKSSWVENEWQTKYWEEIETKQVKVLPLLLESCEIPKLLQPKKYADFRNNYPLGLVKLTASISPMIQEGEMIKVKNKEDSDDSIPQLIQQVHTQTSLLSKIIAEALIIARRRKMKGLEHFCRKELGGWYGEADKKIPDYRLKEVIVSPYGDLNLNYFGWGGNASAMFDYMRTNKKTIFCSKNGFSRTAN